MGSRIFYEPYYDATAFGNTTFFCPFKANRNIILTVVRTWIVLVNNAPFTSVNLKLYSNTPSNMPGGLIATSTNSFTKAEIFTNTNGFKEIYFEFDEINLNGNTRYNFVMNGTGYTGSSTSHVGWRKGFPDPVYRTNFTPTFENLGISPFALYVVGEEF